MMSRIFIFLLFAVLGCHAQYENHRSSDLKQRNKAARGSDRDELSNSRQMRKREMDSESMYHNCFVSKGCFGYPSGCISRSDCEVFLTFKNDEKGVTFQMKGALDPENYMAMGLSMDSQMGDDAVTECFRQGSKVMVRESWNDGKSNANTRELLEASYDGEFKDGMVTCTWTEDYNKVSNGRRFQLDQNNYHLLLAKGAMRDNRMGYHFAAKIGSQESVNFTAFDLIAGEGVSDAIKIHDSTTEAILVSNTDESVMGRKSNENDSSVGTKLVFSYAMIALTLAALRVAWLIKL